MGIAWVSICLIEADKDNLGFIWHIGAHKYVK